MFRLVGALLLVSGCAWIGRMKVGADKRNIRVIGEFVKGINTMLCELEFRRTPLPDLCRVVAECTEGVVSGYFSALERELSNFAAPNVKSCSDTVIRQYGDIPADLKPLFSLTGESLGMFGVNGQAEQLRYIKEKAENMLEHVQKRFEVFGHTHQTLWICAGVALAVIMF